MIARSHIPGYFTQKCGYNDRNIGINSNMMGFKLIHVSKRGPRQFYPYIIQAYFHGSESKQRSASEITL